MRHKIYIKRIFIIFFFVASILMTKFVSYANSIDYGIGTYFKFYGKTFQPHKEIDKKLFMSNLGSGIGLNLYLGYSLEKDLIEYISIYSSLGYSVKYSSFWVPYSVFSLLDRKSHQVNKSIQLRNFAPTLGIYIKINFARWEDTNFFMRMGVEFYRIILLDQVADITKFEDYLYTYRLGNNLGEMLNPWNMILKGSIGLEVISVNLGLELSYGLWDHFDCENPKFKKSFGRIAPKMKMGQGEICISLFSEFSFSKYMAAYEEDREKYN